MSDTNKTPSTSNGKGLEAEKIPSPAEDKIQKLDRERTTLLSRLTESNLEDVRTKVAFVLNQYPATRNSDIALTIKYWELFHPDLVANYSVSFDNLHVLPRFTSISRSRAKIQNEYHLYQASEAVAEQRAELDSEERKSQVETKPIDSLTSIFCDESGRSARFNLVGSLWINDGHRYFKVSQELKKSKSDKGIDKELHFTKLKAQDKCIVEEFIKMVLGQSDAFGFKAVVLDSSTVTGMSPEEINFRLHYQLIVKGIEHEVESSRFGLPRKISVTKDKDAGADKLRLAELKQKLQIDCQAYFDQKIKIDEVNAEESHSSLFIQLTDLFTASINRKLNSPGSNYKDELADIILNLLGIKDVSKAEDKLQDFARIIWV